jgi:hypothetical protein
MAADFCKDRHNKPVGSEEFVVGGILFTGLRLQTANRQLKTGLKTAKPLMGRGLY